MMLRIIRGYEGKEIVEGNMGERIGDRLIFLYNNSEQGASSQIVCWRRFSSICRRLGPRDWVHRSSQMDMDKTGCFKICVGLRSSVS